MKKINLKKIIKGVCFVVIFAVLFFNCQKLFQNKWLYSDDAANATTSTWKEFEQQEKNSLDVVFIGTSHLLYGIDPMYLYGKTGITSYVISGPGTRFDLTWLALEKVLKTQNPKFVFMDVSGSHYAGQQKESLIHKSLDELPLSIGKVEYAFNSGNGKLTPLEALFPFFRYHSRWTTLRKEDFQYLTGDLEKTFVRGHYISDLTEKVEMTFYDEVEYEFSERNRMYLKRIVDLCEEKGIDLILGKVPSPSWQKTVSDAVEKEAQALGVEYWELFYSMEEIGIDPDVDYSDEDHLNQYGAEKMTDYMCNYLLEQYEFEDKRGNNEAWDYDYELYQAHIKEIFSE